MVPAEDELGDYSEAADDEEQEALTADVAMILAGRTVVPAAVMWWRTRRGRRADKEVGSPHWWEL